MQLVFYIVCAAGLAGLVAIGVKRLFPKRGNWLPVLIATFVPPFVFIIISVYRALIQLGVSAGPDGVARPGSIDLFMTSVSAYVFFTVIWLFVAVPASFAALHFVDRK